jgi:hypothetical protein
VIYCIYSQHSEKAYLDALKAYMKSLLLSMQSCLIELRQVLNIDWSLFFFIHIQLPFVNEPSKALCVRKHLQKIKIGG